MINATSIIIKAGVSIFLYFAKASSSSSVSVRNDDKSLLKLSALLSELSAPVINSVNELSVDCSDEEFPALVIVIVYT